MIFSEELKKRQDETEMIICRFLPRETEGLLATLGEMIRYNMEAPGKRLRPILMMEAYHRYGGSEQVEEPFMAALEMIHTHSLIHDDLPALDNDDYRRGRKTTHTIYGEALAILCGDALLNYAYETAFQAFEGCSDPSAVAKALKILGRKAGMYGMLGGQSVDVQNEGKPLSRTELDFIYQNKTAALLEAPLMIGAVLAGADEAEIARMEKVGHCIGIAFQIQDDILDVTSSQEELGKPIHSDEKNEKKTYVTLMGIDQAAAEVKRLSDQARDLLQGDGEDFLCSLIDHLVTRKK